MARWTRFVILPSFAVCTFLVSGEVAVRVFDVVDRLNGFPRSLYAASDHPHLTYTMNPGVDIVFRGVSVRTNEHGLRGPSTTLTPQPGTQRVLALGDSSTFGSSVPVEATWPAVLEAELVRATGRRWEVLNGGVEGWNTEGELAYWELKGKAFAPQVVVVAFNLNDFDAMPVMNGQGVLSLTRSERISTWSPANWSEFFLVLRLVIRDGKRTFAKPFDATNPAPAAGEFHPFDRFVSDRRKEYYRRPSDERWQTLAESIMGFGRVAAKKQPPVFVVILPDGDQFGSNPDLLPQQKVSGLCDDAGLECIDLYEAFRAAGGRALFRDIMHPNAEGYRVVARVVMERLLAKHDPEV